MGNNVKKLRCKHGLSQIQLAAKCGMTKQNLHILENGHLNVKKAKVIAEQLGENVFVVLGTDALLAVPETEEDKAILIEIIKEL